jgi:hypothetical protein
MPSGARIQPASARQISVESGSHHFERFVFRLREQGDGAHAGERAAERQDLGAQEDAPRVGHFGRGAAFSEGMTS